LRGRDGRGPGSPVWLGSGVATSPDRTYLRLCVGGHSGSRRSRLKEGGLLMGFFRGQRFLPSRWWRLMVRGEKASQRRSVLHSALRPRWKKTAAVVPPVALIIGLTLALTGAFAAEEVKRGIGFVKGCASETAIGSGDFCSYSILNTPELDEAEDT